MNKMQQQNMYNQQNMNFQQPNNMINMNPSMNPNMNRNINPNMDPNMNNQNNRINPNPNINIIPSPNTGNNTNIIPNKQPTSLPPIAQEVQAIFQIPDIQDRMDALGEKLYFFIHSQITNNQLNKGL